MFDSEYNLRKMLSSRNLFFFFVLLLLLFISIVLVQMDMQRQRINALECKVNTLMPIEIYGRATGTDLDKTTV